MRRMFDEELADLDTSFKEMGLLVSETLEESVQVFLDHDREKAQEIIDRDKAINHREIAIEKKTFEMIALYQPVTTDLREIVTILKAVSVLERIGDNSRNIAISTIHMKGTKRIPEIETLIGEVGKEVAMMVRKVLDFYVNDDIAGAESMATEAGHVSEEMAEIRNKSIQAMKEDPEFVAAATDYIVVGGYLKRTEDYVTDIAEWIIYKRTGKIVELNPGTSSYL
ncbi:phosphate signaling complex protein PhoU [Weissella tructae]|uniref:Phosphate-specific transport system accessory protein PhoU n=2 Tax=Weissella TaxID=46255 RepID=A0A075U6Z2_9LACO|nr:MULTISPECIES: phosphate signaling complex protein PhoU [Weissella]AIG65882.1 Phosphate-specific transport system accessory protein PhoU [Weissella tructae]AIM63261.1 Phosphate-specific transport system accessory protein PhoU [Weissella ceti]AIM64595.1 Phosphate-specific transport system accessory protein PhoU [Weissella ceti]ELA07253.1 phosphate uptake regulator [Weissella ceti NC36]QVV91041.1 phosphate signaling complex protein PhoU [Weissella tructae]